MVSYIQTAKAAAGDRLLHVGQGRVAHVDGHCDVRVSAIILCHRAVVAHAV